MCGRAYGHPRFADGERVITSPIVELRDGRVVTHSGTFYELGQVDLNALTDAFAINREFAYLVLLLCLISPPDPETSPVPSPSAAELTPVISILTYTALSRSNTNSTIQ